MTTPEVEEDTVIGAALAIAEVPVALPEMRGIYCLTIYTVGARHQLTIIDATGHHPECPDRASCEREQQRRRGLK